MTRRFYGIFLPVLAGSAPTLALFVGGGFIVYLFGILSLVLLFGIIFLAIGISIGRAFPEQGWRSGIWLSIPYLIWLAVALIYLFSFNLEQNGVFLRIEFFPVAAFLYLTPIVIACAGSYVGSDFSRKSVSLLVASLVLTFAAVIYVGFLSASTTEKDTFSFSLIENKDLHLTAEITCERMIGKNYMRFFNTDRTDCSYSKLFVLKKPSDYPLPLTISVTTGGVEESLSVSPQLDATGDVFGLDASKQQDFNNTTIWLAFVPWQRIARSQQGKFTWGKINIDFGESELKNLRETIGTYDD